jgi:HNH endonuclease
MPVAKNCENCGTEFMVTPSHIRRRFCDRKCQNAHEKEHGRLASRVAPLDFTCQQCGKPFQVKPAYVRAYKKQSGKDPMYCSTQCFGDYRRASADTKSTLACIECGGPLEEQRTATGVLKRGNHLCSDACRGRYWRRLRQKEHSSGQPSVRKYKNGYLRIYIPGVDGSKPREMFHHRYVMEQKLGRPLLPHETVHHRDGDRGHNTEDNLELFSSRHGPGQRVTDKVAFAIEMLRLYPEFAREAGVALVEVHQGQNLPA